MKVLLGMSGGVDSTYAVHELRRMGYEVFGAVILMHEYTETEEAKLSAEALGVPLYVIDGRRLFEEKVVSSFMNEYLSGRTPNPCIICNREVKFKLLLDFALENGFDKMKSFLAEYRKERARCNRRILQSGPVHSLAQC